MNRSSEEEHPDADTEVRLAMARAQLFTQRCKRVWPGWDDKVLADWNGLMIGALAFAGQVFEEPSWVEAAERAFGFVSTVMVRDGRLTHSWRHGRLKHPATLEDYANLCDAALALHEATGNPDYLTQATEWIDVLDSFYLDPEKGGYFMTASDTEQLIVRSKSAYDSAVPSGNGVIAGVLARLYYLTGSSSYLEKAESVIKAFSGELERNFFPIATLINHAEFLTKAEQIVLLGSRTDPELVALKAIVDGISLPNRVLQIVDTGDDLGPDHPAHGKLPANGRATAFVCRGMTCSLPITAPEDLAKALQA